MGNKTKREKQIFQSAQEAVRALKEEKAFCFHCGCEIKVEGENIINGVLLSYMEDEEEIFLFKCDKCFSSKKELSDYKECEVYSRIVGYLRPVKQWNAGKRQEYTERKEYSVPQN